MANFSFGSFIHFLPFGRYSLIKCFSPETQHQVGSQQQTGFTAIPHLSWVRIGSTARDYQFIWCLKLTATCLCGLCLSNMAINRPRAATVETSISFSKFCSRLQTRGKLFLANSNQTPIYYWASSYNCDCCISIHLALQSGH